MGKKLVGTDNLDEAICQATGKVYADGTIILTPGAKDELSKRGVPIVYGPAPERAECAPTPMAEAASPGLEKLVLAVSAILNTQYGIKNPEQLKVLSCQVVKTIKENI
ncbi:MAG: hypothetical protein HY795_15105 [Desulfovibrio sp.]|nr:hypothetical protein [Desulfovibrio sp.]MBI4960620.1 hypothetical protein [Desulfovibrio sp.]